MRHINCKDAERLLVAKAYLTGPKCREELLWLWDNVDICGDDPSVSLSPGAAANKNVDGTIVRSFMEKYDCDVSIKLLRIAHKATVEERGV